MRIHWQEQNDDSHIHSQIPSGIISLGKHIYLASNNYLMIFLHLETNIFVPKHTIIFDVSTYIRAIYLDTQARTVLYESLSKQRLISWSNFKVT
jgi:predicted membrane protein